MNDYVEITKTPNGNLALSIPKEEDRLEVLEQLKDKPECFVWGELIETYDCNGSYTSVNPNVHFVGLTSDPYILAEYAAVNDDGSLEVVGGMWHYDGYMLHSVCEKLANGETVILHKFDDTEGKAVRIESMVG